ncbi:hypothetical protein KDV25_16405 [Morganella morganii]|uniref:hypothetical protein n=3 Tax=Enterobacterales TaxID=91347 RepID=UPI000418CD3B|nr:hypothetical protein [Morganella morganii]HCK3361659.1 hypothetical protein [Morganella morganii]
MCINFDIVIDSHDYSVDMNSGLETLKGASEATRQIASTLLNEHVPKRLTSDNKVRTKLKKTFEGSFGQIFSLEIECEDLKRRFKRIGRDVFSELMSYFIHEALYRETPTLSNKADEILNNLTEKLQNELIDQLRLSSLSRLHNVSINFNKDVKIRYRNNKENKVLISVNRDSYSTLKPKTDKTKVNIIASITRLNINTGNGRLLIKGQSDTVAFGFPARYEDVKKTAKKQFSANLDNNNGISRDEWKTLSLKAHTQKTNDGRIIKYLIEEIN